MSVSEDQPTKKKKRADDKSMPVKNTQYKKIKSLAKYIDRIGAEQLNFKQFMIKEYKTHYYKEKVLIKLSPEGEITCTNETYDPTKEEAEAIKQEVPAYSKDWPNLILAKSLAGLDKFTKAKNENLWEFWDRQRGGVVMAQERRYNKEGLKYYIPWTLYSDGSWLSMEPDCPLPLWKPRKKLRNKIMIHEGAKCGRYVDWLCHSNDEAAKALRKTHPWIEVLLEYDHWGMIGGALAPGRSDYESIRKERALEVVYICDNDDEGKDAIATVSKEYGQYIKAVKFDSRWPQKWDLADPLTNENCPELFGANGAYKGPELDKLMVSATWATDLIKKERRTVAVLRKSFVAEWSHSVRPEYFIHRDRPNVMLSADEFNSTVDPFSDSRDTAALLRQKDVSKGNIIAYDPGRKPGNYVLKNGERYINTHVPTLIAPEKGNAKPFLDYMEHLVPDKKERDELIKWCATLVAKPSVKMHYGVLLVSEVQGVGKSTLGEKVLIPLVGEWNTSSPSEKEVVESAFNDWCAQKRLAVIHEIYSGQSAKAYNNLKTIITDKFINVNRKFVSAFTIENWLHVFACSNSLRALKLSSDDRRWFVPKVNEYKQTPEYWIKFNRWLEDEDGLPIIFQYLIDYVAKHGFVRKGEDAPWTTTKQEVIEEGMSPGQLLVGSLLDQIKDEGAPGDFTTDHDLQERIMFRLYEGRRVPQLEKPLTIRKVAKSKGWFIGEKQIQFSGWGDGNRNARLITQTKQEAAMDPSQLAQGEPPTEMGEAGSPGPMGQPRKKLEIKRKPFVFKGTGRL